MFLFRLLTAFLMLLLIEVCSAMVDAWGILGLVPNILLFAGLLCCRLRRERGAGGAA
jgi:hypothetical protein